MTVTVVVRNPAGGCAGVVITIVLDNIDDLCSISLWRVLVEYELDTDIELTTLLNTSQDSYVL